MNFSLYSKEYVARGRAKSYIDKDIKPNVFDSFISWMTIVVYFVGTIPCRIPLLDQVIEFIITDWPRGRIGFILRGVYWKTKIGYMGQDVFIDRGVTIFPDPGNVFIGSGTHIDTNVTIISGGTLQIGREVHIASNVVLNSKPFIEIGDRACISANCSVYASTNRHTDGINRKSFSACAPDEEQCVEQVGFRMGNYSFVGANCVVIPNAELGEYSVLGAGSFLNKKIEAYEIFVGTPSKNMKTRVMEELVEAGKD